jgi:hypothetical protein
MECKARLVSDVHEVSAEGVFVTAGHPFEVLRHLGLQRAHDSMQSSL